jgi:hypothetical protein
LAIKAPLPSTLKSRKLRTYDDSGLVKTFDAAKRIWSFGVIASFRFALGKK